MFDSAYYFQSIYIVANDSIKNIESVQKMADLRTEYEVGKKQAEVDALEKIKVRNTIIIIGLGIILLLAIGLVTSHYRNLKRSRQLTLALEERRIILENQSTELKEKNDKILSANEELTVLNEAISKQNLQILEANEELTVLNEAISKQKNEILDSITYAKKIQAAMLPPEQYFHEILNDAFILFKPRDIVSGDFYWIKHVNQYVILAAADCTGHGVPGAFMSMLGMSYLNEIVHRREVTQANQVLNELRRQIRNSLRQHGEAEESKDGIDMALCVIDEKNKTLQYSGANNPLYLIRDHNGAPELKEFKADRMPLGYYQGTFKTFTNQDIQLEYGDVFYLFSDGFVDQKGGRDSKKFMSRRFKNLLLKIHQEPMRDQKNILDKTITDWMGDHSQIDDILVIGVRV
jgi:serine phosphatase RsbU (regulator of sigma subunit)